MAEQNKSKNIKPKNQKYPPESAGRIMSGNVPVIGKDAAIKDAEDLLLKKTKEFDSINYVYVVDGREKLIGVISIKEIFKQPKNTPVAEVMVKDVISVKSFTDQEKVAILALERGIKAVPVVDEDGKFLGAVSNDSIMSIIREEAHEDILHLVGITDHKRAMDNILEISPFLSFKHRIPWLIIGLLGGILAAKIVGLFEGTLSKHIILAAFIPLIVYMADAVGTQMEVFMVRDLSLNHRLKIFNYVMRHLFVVFMIAVIVAALLFGFSFVLYKNLLISLVLCIGLAAAIVSSVFTGLLTPYFLSRFNIDPANASGPIATVAQDIISVIIYFSVAEWLL